MKNFLSAICFLGIFLTSSLALAQQQVNQAVLNKAISDIIGGEGRVSKEQYDGFWKEVGVDGDKASKKKVIASVRDNFLLVQGYQQEIWKCAESAWVFKKPSPCNGAKTKLAKIKAEFKKVGQGSAFDPIEKNSEEILSAAAKRSATFKAGPAEVPLSLGFIQKTRKSMERVFARVNQLFREEYAE